MKGVTKTISLIILGLVVFSLFSSTYPDGLEKVAESLGIEEPEHMWYGLMPDYTIRIIKNSYVTKLVSGLIGIFLVFIIARSIGKAASKWKNKQNIT